MKIEEINTPEQSGVKVTLDWNGVNDLTVFISWSDFWELCRFGTKKDVKSEVADCLLQCDEICGLDLSKINITDDIENEIIDKVIDIRSSNDNSDQIYDAAEYVLKTVHNFGKKVSTRIFDIEWDKDDDDDTDLPTEVVFEFFYNGDDDEFSDTISDWLSDEYGYCHYGFHYEMQ